MLGKPTTYDRTPYSSNQYDLGMEYRGWAPSFDRVVFRGEPAGRAFIAFWLRHNRVVAAMHANIWDAGEAIEALLQAGHPQLGQCMPDRCHHVGWPGHEIAGSGTDRSERCPSDLIDHGGVDPAVIARVGIEAVPGESVDDGQPGL
ncbi:MAG: oxidoreductase C-terminal domain-containing protein [Acidimicrobiales bacterium]